ncbi:MAG: hypothetical protein PHV02_17355 [Rhodocyclaceae bacterium]|nr:hypothetical protein [Rhodocyclaceae bacterium]
MSETATPEINPDVQAQIDAAVNSAITGLRAKNSELIGSLKAAKEAGRQNVGDEIERVKSEVSQGFQAQLDEANARAQKLEQALHSEKVDGSFARSKFAEKLVVPTDMLKSFFGQQFKIEDGRMVAFDVTGNKIYSTMNPGEPAEFEEALEKIIEAYPKKDAILRATASGSGAIGNNYAHVGGSKSISRSRWDSMDQAARMEFTKCGGKVTD